jgi:hypothetical protein
MPPGTVGLRASGKLTRKDYSEVLEPALREAVESGEVRLLFLLTGFAGLEPSALLSDIRTGLVFGVCHRSAWKRLAFVTDAAWVRKATRAFAWLIPGELVVCEPDRLEEAERWVAT